MNRTATHTATSTYNNVHQVTISAKGIVHTATGVLLGDVEGMERLGWEFAEIATVTTPTFSFDLATGEGRVSGGGWDIRYQGCGDALTAWSLANADGFHLAPGAFFEGWWGATPVVR